LSAILSGERRRNLGRCELVVGACVVDVLVVDEGRVLDVGRPPVREDTAAVAPAHRSNARARLMAA
jgi:hypothetical protein